MTGRRHRQHRRQLASINRQPSASESISRHPGDKRVVNMPFPAFDTQTSFTWHPTRRTHLLHTGSCHLAPQHLTGDHRCPSYSFCTPGHRHEPGLPAPGIPASRRRSSRKPGCRLVRRQLPIRFRQHSRVTAVGTLHHASGPGPPTRHDLHPRLRNNAGTPLSNTNVVLRADPNSDFRCSLHGDR